MTTLTRKNYELVGYGKLLFFLLGSLIFSISSRLGDVLTLEQHILSIVSDHYYLTFFVIPLLLFSYCSFIEDDSENVIVRFGSYFSYFCRKWLSTGSIAFLFVAIQTVCIVLSGIGLSTGNVWTLPMNHASAELFAVLQLYFKSPLSAIIAYTAFQFLGTWFLAGLCMWIGHFAGHKRSIRILMFLYVLAAMWTKTPTLQKLPITGLNHLIILHHNLGSAYRFAKTVITVVLFTFSILFTVYRLWRTHFAFALIRQRGLILYYMRELISKKNLAILCATIILIIIYKILQNPYLETSEEWVYYLFSGHGTGYLQILPFLEMIIVNGVVLYLLAAFIEKAVSGQSIFISVRTRGRKELLIAILMAGAEFMFLYCCFWLIGGFVGTYFAGYEWSVTALQYLICAVALKYLELLFQYFVMFTIYVYAKHITVGFLALIAGNLLCVMPFGFTAYLPLGLSSMVRIDFLGDGTGISAALAFATLASLVMLMVLWQLKCGYRKLLN